MNFDDAVALATSLDDALPPLAVDIDGTLTDNSRAVDPRVFPILRAWPKPLVVATGKAMPYPVALCEFVGLEQYVIAENGGVVLCGRSSVQYLGDRTAATAVLEDYLEAGYETGWGDVDLVNRWRETEIAISRDSPLAPLESIASEYGLEVVDTGYAFHVKSPDMSKGKGLEAFARELAVDPERFAAIGDSENDASTFDRVEHAIAVANCDETARKRADFVTDGAFVDGFLEAVEWLQKEYCG